MRGADSLPETLGALRSVYAEAPCQALPNALWKTVARVPHSRRVVARERGKILGVELRDEDRLIAHWWRDRKHRLPDDLDCLSMALIHADFADQVPDDLLQDRTAFFRLQFVRPSVPRVEWPVGIRLADVQPGEESQVARFLECCYPGLEMSVETVRRWRVSDVFRPDSWVWAVRESDGCYVGLGIAEHDTSIGEGSLEWIQVLPEARRLGLGLVLVRELTNRLMASCRFVTVSGRVSEEGAAERLYRRCGFEGTDTWWLMRRLETQN